MPLLTEPNQNLKREDISDEMVIVDAKSTPFTTMLRKGPAPENTLFEYPVDSYASPKTTGRADGADVASGDIENHASARTKVAARIQWFLRAGGAGKIANTVPDVAGVGKGKEFSRAAVKKMVELKRDMEYTFLSTNESAADDGTNGSKTRGVGKWVQNGAQSDQPVPAAFRPAATQVKSITGSDVSTLTEADIQGILEAMFQVTGSKGTYHCFCRTGVKRQFTSFTLTQTQSSTVLPLRRYTQDQADSTITASIDRYEGDFGTILLIPDLWMDATNAPLQHAYILNMDRWHCRPQQRPMMTELPFQGGGRKFMVDAIEALACDNPLGEAKIVTTA